MVRFFLTAKASLAARALFLVATIFVVATVAQSPKPRQILERGVAAMGGKEKLKAIRSRHAIGTIKRLQDGAIGRYELITQFPGRFYLRMEFGAEF